ncbi:hypothetical protein ACTJI8_12885 [Microbacterium sp. 22303]|uniref:hypothetical protein n=1 Tax=Microbacterium sp. 22303 TaxID=3453905 RepID=UPI003F82C8F4
MSIHTTGDGRRCEEPAPPAHREPPRSAPRRSRARDERDLQTREKLAKLGDTTRLPKWQRDLEREAAFNAAAESKRRKRDEARVSSKPFDRKIYAVGGVRTVAGGSPGGGKRR